MVCIKKIKPQNVIESGVFKGQGTWLISRTLPDAKIFSIDLVLSKRIYIDERTTYFSNDFNLIDWTGIDSENTLCFFDDHQDAYRRLQQMRWMGFKKAMFEDNYPVSQGDCYSCKKILAECGLKINGEEKIPPTSAHARYFMQNVKTYTTLPPLFKNEYTRWGDSWDAENYPTPKEIFQDEDIEKYKIVKEESGEYTWICYVELV